ncbi:MAG: prolyl oligopeptidase family serine peptidase [Rhodospirillales bacterium]|nr:prolyl oligopeptidase family serine peptidase [Rhodospirillales bacterium]
MIGFEAGKTGLWIPPDRGSAGGPPPLILFLHGIGERGCGGPELARVAAWGLPKLRTTNGLTNESGFPFLVVAPQCPPDRHWCDREMRDAVAALVDHLVATGAADPARLYLAGFSMGGIGSFCIALDRPLQFAALVSVCGACEDQPERLPELAHLPMWIAYGEDDEIERLTRGSKDVVARLSRFGRLVERPFCVGRAGNIGAHPRTADAAFAETALYHWLLDPRHARPPSGP